MEKEEPVTPPLGKEATERKPSGFPYYPGLQPYPYSYPHGMSVVYDPPPMLVPVSSVRGASPNNHSSVTHPLTMTVQPQRMSTATLHDEHSPQIAEKHHKLKQTSPFKQEKKKDAEKRKLVTSPPLLKKEMKSIECQVDDMVLETLTKPETVQQTVSGQTAQAMPAKERKRSGGKTKKTLREVHSSSVSIQEEERRVTDIMEKVIAETKAEIKTKEENVEIKPLVLHQEADSTDSAMPKLIKQASCTSPLPDDSVLQHEAAASVLQEMSKTVEAGAGTPTDEDALSELPKLEKMEIEPAIEQQEHKTDHPEQLAPSSQSSLSTVDIQTSHASNPTLMSPPMSSTSKTTSDITEKEREVATIMASGMDAFPWQPAADNKASAWQVFADAALSSWHTSADEKALSWQPHADSKESSWSVCNNAKTLSSNQETASTAKADDESSAAANLLSPASSHTSDSTGLGLLCALAEEKYVKLVESDTKKHELKRQDSAESIFSEGTHVSNLITEINRNQASTPEKNMKEFIQQSCLPASKTQDIGKSCRLVLGKIYF